MSDKQVPLRVTFDAEVDASYIYLVDEIGPGEVAKTYCCDPIDVGGMVNLDFDAAGRLLGIEILGARSYLDPRLLS